MRTSQQNAGRIAHCAAAIVVIGTGCSGTNYDPPDASMDAAHVAPNPASSGSGSGHLAAREDAGGGARTDGGVPPEVGVDAACAGEGVPPSTLACTGLYADIASKTLAAGVHFYQPAVPLWSDNAQKSRWILLPPGTQIDATDPNEWTFPIGTKLWKEFSKNGKRVETRMFQKVDSGSPAIWSHATYAWNADETAAVASEGGDITLDSDGSAYHIPTFTECEKCHNGRTDKILGFEQVSLGLPNAQGLTLAALVSAGLIAPAPARTGLSIGDDGTGAAAPALAWLHINCGVTCHNGNPRATEFGLGMRLRLDATLLDGRPLTTANVDPMQTTMGVLAHSPGWILPVQWTRIVPGDPTDSLLIQLISHRGTMNPAGAQMPPIATTIVDTADVAKVVEWVGKMPAPSDGGAATDAGANQEPADAGDAQLE